MFGLLIARIQQGKVKSMVIERILLQHARSPCVLRSLSTFPTIRLLAMKPGTPIPGLDFLKNIDPPVSKERSEYPEWINDLGKPMKTLAKLRKMKREAAEDDEQMRYLKLTRRKSIKESNIDAGLR